MYQLKIIFLILNLIVLTTCTTKISEISEPIDDLLRNYDSRFRPFYGKHAVNVKVSMYVIKMFDFSEQDSMVKIDFYFRQRWTDPRLSFENTTIPPYIDEINLGADMAKKIWQPDTFSSSSNKLSVVSKDQSNTFVLIYRNGTVFISRRLSAKIQCIGSRAWFPFDQRECHFNIESYSMKTKDILYQWYEEKDMVVLMNLIPFHINPGKYSSNYYALLTGVYSIISVKFKIERYYFNYLLTFYLPIILTTILAGKFLYNSKLDWSNSSSSLSCLLLFIAQLICSILIKINLNISTFTCLDVFLVINFLFMFIYQLMHINPEFRTTNKKSLNSDTKVILDENTYSNTNQYNGFIKHGLTLFYSIFIVSYLFVCITMRFFEFI